MAQLPEYVKTSNPSGYEFMKQEGEKSSIPGFVFKNPNGEKKLIPLESYVNESPQLFEKASALIMRLVRMRKAPVPWLFKAFCVLSVGNHAIEGFTIEKIESFNSNKKINYQKMFEDFKSNLPVEKPVKSVKNSTKKTSTTKTVPDKNSTNSTGPVTKPTTTVKNVAKVKPVNSTSSVKTVSKTVKKIKPVASTGGKATSVASTGGKATSVASTGGKSTSKLKPTTTVKEKQTKMVVHVEDDSTTSESDSETTTRKNSLECPFPNNFQTLHEFLYSKNGMPENEQTLSQALSTPHTKGMVYIIKDYKHPPNGSVNGREHNIPIGDCIFVKTKVETKDKILNFGKFWFGRYTQGPIAEWAALSKWKSRAFINPGTGFLNEVQLNVVFIQTEYYPLFTPVIMVKNLKNLQRSELVEIPDKIFFFRTWYGVSTYLQSMIKTGSDNKFRADPGIKNIRSLVGELPLSDVLKWPANITAQEIKQKYGVQVEKLQSVETPPPPPQAQEVADEYFMSNQRVHEQEEIIDKLNEEVNGLKKNFDHASGQIQTFEIVNKKHREETEKNDKAISNLSTFVMDIEEHYPQSFKNNYGKKGSLDQKIGVVRSVRSMLENDVRTARSTASERERILKRKDEEILNVHKEYENLKRKFDEVDTSASEENKKLKIMIANQTQEIGNQQNQLKISNLNFVKLADSFVTVREEQFKKTQETLNNLLIAQSKINYNPIVETFGDLMRQGMLGPEPLQRLNEIEKHSAKVYQGINQ